MKTTHIILAAVLVATSAIQAATAEHKLPAPLPEFMNQEQVTKWQADRIAKAQAKKSVETAATQANSAPSTSAFYTGKPYVESLESYSFKYRNYDPELKRWTTADPGGFPDGANNHYYACSLWECDPTGFAKLTIQVNWMKTFGEVKDADGIVIESGHSINCQESVDVDYTITNGSPHQSISVPGTWEYTASPIRNFISGNLLNGWQLSGFNLNTTGHFSFTQNASSDAQGHPYVEIHWSYTEGGSLSWSLSKGNVQSPWTIPIVDGETVATGTSRITAE
ncbi:MAG: hypothetical protein M0Q93_10250 [Terrimicrobiaceae bacterium]|nr:hypothetical protein [Terrimicrobiaceae bacterium]